MLKGSIAQEIVELIGLLLDDHVVGCGMGILTGVNCLILIQYPQQIDTSTGRFGEYDWKISGL